MSQQIKILMTKLDFICFFDEVTSYGDRKGKSLPSIIKDIGEQHFIVRTRLFSVNSLE
ncbi:MAG: hypothetical protein RMY34_03230 [Aulosira sp. DedQUE10]|nr:hypothetical protein [Aulosira sp. DedQUE10]